MKAMVFSLVAFLSICASAQANNDAFIISDETCISANSLDGFSGPTKIALDGPLSQQLGVGQVLVRQQTADGKFCVFIATLDAKKTSEYNHFKYPATMSIDSLLKLPFYEYQMEKEELLISTVVFSKYGFYVKDRTSVSILTRQNWVTIESEKHASTASQKAEIRTKTKLKTIRKVANISGFTLLGLGVVVHIAAFTAGDDAAQVHPAGFICDVLGLSMFGIGYLYKMQEKAILGMDETNFPSLQLCLYPSVAMDKSGNTLRFSLKYNHSF